MTDKFKPILAIPPSVNVVPPTTTSTTTTVRADFSPMNLVGSTWNQNSFLSNANQNRAVDSLNAFGNYIHYTNNNQPAAQIFNRTNILLAANMFFELYNSYYRSVGGVFITTTTQAPVSNVCNCLYVDVSIHGSSYQLQCVMCNGSYGIVVDED